MAAVIAVISYHTSPLTATVLATVRNRCNFLVSVILVQKTYGYITLIPILRTGRPAARAPQAIFDQRLAASLECLLLISSLDLIVDLCLASYIGHCWLIRLQRYGR